jgi:hypothetical protein
MQSISNQNSPGIRGKPAPGFDVVVCHVAGNSSSRKTEIKIYVLNILSEVILSYFKFL